MTQTEISEPCMTSLTWVSGQTRRSPVRHGGRRGRGRGDVGGYRVALQGEDVQTAPVQREDSYRSELRTGDWLLDSEAFPPQVKEKGQL